jgi:hypothetical protein
LPSGLAVHNTDLTPLRERRLGEGERNGAEALTARVEVRAVGAFVCEDDRDWSDRDGDATIVGPASGVVSVALQLASCPLRTGRVGPGICVTRPKSLRERQEEDADGTPCAP